MKFDFVIDTVDKVMRIDEKIKNADMHLSFKVPYFGVAMALIGLLITVTSIATFSWFMLVFALITFLISAFLLFYYRNVRIHVLSDADFQHTNFFGKKKIYKFEDIVSIEFNPDSHTLVFRKGRILIESSAFMSERLKLLFNKELDRIHKENSERKHRHKTHASLKISLHRRKNDSNK